MADATLVLLADLVVTLHLLLVLFVVVGLPLIVIGNLRGWGWVNGLLFRIAHLGTIGIVAAESWLDIPCPLTTLEQWLRERAAAPSYGGNFVEHWVHRLLFWEAPEWVFTLLYTAFAALVVAIWIRWPPRRMRAPSRNVETPRAQIG